MSNEILKIKDLEVKYITDEFTVNAVNGLCLSLSKGRTLGLVGETGAGKTSTALSIMGLLPDMTGKVTGGSILFDGTELLSLSEKQMMAYRGNQVAMIYQDPMTSLNPTKTIGKQIEEVFRAHRICEKKEIQEKVKDILALVGIGAERINDYPHQFSGGMKQRVIIAMALACRPILLIADEPTTALDVTIQAQVLEMMKDLKEQLGTSMVLITHDLGVVGEICDEVAIMYAGQIVEQGGVEEVFTHAKHPYTKGLLGAIPDIEKKVDRLVSIEGLMPDPVSLPKGCSFHPRCTFAEEKCGCEAPCTITEGGHLVRCFLYDGEGESRLGVDVK